MYDEAGAARSYSRRERSPTVPASQEHHHGRMEHPPDPRPARQNSRRDRRELRPRPGHRDRTGPARGAGRARRARRRGRRAGRRPHRGRGAAGTDRGARTGPGLAVLGPDVREGADRRLPGGGPAGQQRRTGTPRPGTHHGRRIRTPSRHEHAGPLRPHRPAAGHTRPGRRRQGGRPQLHHPQERPPRLRRPHVTARLRRGPRVRPLQTGHHRLRPGTRPPAARRRLPDHQRPRPPRALPVQSHTPGLGASRARGTDRRTGRPPC